MSPAFTIGIPTYNRVELLEQSLASALNQSCKDIEVIVCDNDSSDNTEAVLRKFGNQIRYFRNESNIGAMANFGRVLELARGKHFSWLQDDDLIHRDYVQRALVAFDAHPNATCYLSYTFYSPSESTISNPGLFGPPLPLDWWGNREPKAFDGNLTIPLSLFKSIAIPPTYAFRTDVLRNAYPRSEHRSILFRERMILIDAAVKREMIADPYIAGMYRHHASQNSKTLLESDPGAHHSEWLDLLAYASDVGASIDHAWEASLQKLLHQVDVDHRLNWLRQTQKWPADSTLCQRIRKMLSRTLPQYGDHHLNSEREETSTKRRLINVARKITPPLAWDIGKASIGLCSRTMRLL